MKYIWVVVPVILLLIALQDWWDNYPYKGFGKYIQDEVTWRWQVKHTNESSHHPN